MPVSSSSYRHLGRDSQHRQALLRNLVDKLFEHEQITTTWHKAKAAQRVAEKLITLGKRNDETARRKAQGMFYVSISLYLSLSLSFSLLYYFLLHRLTTYPLSISDPTSSYPNSLANSAPATPTGQEATRGFSASSPKRKIKHRQPSSKWSIAHGTCDSC
jgi:ribosomal protein L17